MFDHSWLPWDKKAALGENTYRNAFQIIKAQKCNVYFTAENEYIARLHAKLFDIEVEILPIPLSIAPPLRDHDARNIRAGFFGYSKKEKGFHLLPDAIEKCAAARPDLLFTVHVSHHNQEDETVSAEAALGRLPQVQLIRGQLSREEYRAHFARVDIALLPYDPHYFGLRGSGVFTEAVSCGHIIVASKGTWAGENIELGKAEGETFEPYDSQALVRAILAVCDSIAQRKERAYQLASRSAFGDSAAAYVERLLSLGRRVRTLP
jgi:glycosyltransferase involved in cell wall biosynthesis